MTSARSPYGGMTISPARHETASRTPKGDPCRLQTDQLARCVRSSVLGPAQQRIRVCGRSIDDFRLAHGSLRLSQAPSASSAPLSLALPRLAPLRRSRSTTRMHELARAECYAKFALLVRSLSLQSVPCMSSAAASIFGRTICFSRVAVERILVAASSLNDGSSAFPSSVSTIALAISSSRSFRPS